MLTRAWSRRALLVHTEPHWVVPGSQFIHRLDIKRKDYAFSTFIPAFCAQSNSHWTRIHKKVQTFVTWYGLTLACAEVSVGKRSVTL